MIVEDLVEMYELLGGRTAESSLAISLDIPELPPHAMELPLSALTGGQRKLLSLRLVWSVGAVNLLALDDVATYLDRRSLRWVKRAIARRVVAGTAVVMAETDGANFKELISEVGVVRYGIGAISGCWVASEWKSPQLCRILWIICRPAVALVINCAFYVKVLLSNVQMALGSSRK